MPPAQRKPLTVIVCCELVALAGGFAADAHAQAMQPLRVDPVLLGLPPAAPVAPAPAAPQPAPRGEPEAASAPSRAEVRAVTTPAVEAVGENPAPSPAAPAEAAKKAAPDAVPARAVAPPAPPVVAAPAPQPLPLEPATAPAVVPGRNERSERSEREAAPEPATPAPVEPQSLRKPVPEPVVTPAAAPVSPPAPAAAAPVAVPIISSAGAPRPSAASDAGRSPAARPGATQLAGSLPPLRVDPALLGPLPSVAASPPAAVRQADAARAERADRAERASSGVVPVIAGGAAVDAAPARPAPLATSGPRDEADVAEAMPLALHLASAMVPPSAKSDEPRPTFISALRMSGITERETLAEGEVELRKVGTVLNSDRLIYWPLDDELEATGQVRLEQGSDVVTGPRLRLKLEDQVGFFEQPEYSLKRQPKPVAATAPLPLGTPQFAGMPATAAGGFAPPITTSSSVAAQPKRTMTELRGQAERFDFEGENQVRMTKGTFTTCKPGNDDWYARIGDLHLDYDREVGEGRDGAIYFKGVPILYSPWLSFSLNNQRKSGLLAPTFGTTSQSGFDLTLPYYWNIAPNMDATIAPRVFSKRGVQLNTEFRYLDPTYFGQARVELLPGDKLRNENRYGVSLTHNQVFGNGFSGVINYNKVSDDRYYTDLSSRIANTSQTQLLQQGLLSYGGGGWWNATANLQTYQTLQPDPNVPVASPYRLLPQITLNARKPDWNQLDASFLGQYTSFKHPTQVEAQRTVAYPQLALPYVTPGWYVTPKVGVHATNYSFARQAAGGPDSLTRTLPIASIDSGMTFERSSNWFGRDYTQTMEPRLYYLYVPFRDQSRINVFDSGLADFNFAQIFSENQFTGQDRISDANQLTAAVTSRLIEPGTGREIMRGMIGQRFYFSDQQVSLPGAARREWNKSDFLAAFSGQVLPKVYADAALQYNMQQARYERMSIGARYLPEPGKVLNAAYRYNRNEASPIDQVDVSGQWPLFGGWHAVGRYNYSLREKQPVETLGGLEFNGGCWVLRVVGQRLATATSTASTAFFVQLELSDFSRIGSNPLELLKRNIQGYGNINQPTSDPVFGQ